MAQQSTQRPRNLCQYCTYTWYPRGRNLSVKCPHCGSENVSLFFDNTTIEEEAEAVTEPYENVAVPPALSTVDSTPTTRGCLLQLLKLLLWGTVVLGAIIYFFGAKKSGIHQAILARSPASTAAVSTPTSAPSMVASSAALQGLVSTASAAMSEGSVRTHTSTLPKSNASSADFAPQQAASGPNTARPNFPSSMVIPLSNQAAVILPSVSAVVSPSPPPSSEPKSPTPGSRLETPTPAPYAN